MTASAETRGRREWKAWIAKNLRRRAFQGLWERLHHYSTMGMNFYAATVEDSGERRALAYAARGLKDVDPVIVFDVGANVGQFAFAAVEAFGNRARVHSFEPSARTFRMLADNVVARGLGEMIEPVQLGFGATEGDARLFSSGPGSSIASLYHLENPLSPLEDTFSEVIEITTLDAYCEAHDISQIDYLKLDIEGHELFALKGAARMLAERRVRFVQFEFGEANIDSRTYMRDFHSLLGPDYWLHRIVADGLRLIPAYSGELEVFATINYLAELKA
jgi:FkbM family methyltransferase